MSWATMLPCKRVPRWRSPPPRHYYSSQPPSPYPFRNLRAFPFLLSPATATRFLAPFASLVKNDALFSSVVARFVPSLGFEPLKPTRLTPVYFPGWILDVEVKGKANLRGAEREAYAQVHDVYIPGSDYQVLASAPIAPVTAHTKESIPFSEDLMRQHGLEIACIPYNISPFSLTDITHHLSYSEAIISEDLRFTPSSVKPSLFAAYPVLIPLYLAQYEYDTEAGKRYHTFFIEAYGTHGNIWCEPLTDHHSTEREMIKFARSFATQSDDTNSSVTNLGYPKRFVDTAGFSLTPHQETGLALREYLENALNLPSTPTALAAASVDELDRLAEDPRIREFTADERTPIIEWLKVGLELMMVRRMYEAMSRARDSSEIEVMGSAASNSEGKMAIVNSTIVHLKEKIRELEIERRKMKPHWARTQDDLEEPIADAEETPNDPNSP